MNGNLLESLSFYKYFLSLSSSINESSTSTCCFFDDTLSLPFQFAPVHAFPKTLRVRSLDWKFSKSFLGKTTFMVYESQRLKVRVAYLIVPITQSCAIPQLSLLSITPRVCIVLGVLVGCQNDFDKLKFGRKLELVFITSPQPWGSKSSVSDGHGRDLDSFSSDISLPIGVREEAKLEIRSSTDLIHRFAGRVTGRKGPS